MSEHIRWIDIAKGITILLVIVGHSIGITALGNVLRGCIFSFHMPLFFIMSALTYRCSSNTKEFRVRAYRSFKRLIVPALVLFVINAVFHYFSVDTPPMIDAYCKECLLSLLYSSGVNVQVSNHMIEPVGIVWFLFVLFSARVLYDSLVLYLKPFLLLPVVLSLSVIGVCFGYKVWLPFSFDISLAILPLVFMGDLFKDLDWSGLRKKYYVPSALVWLLLFMILFVTRNSYMEIAKRHYTLYPICFICAVAGTFMISFVSQSLSKVEVVSRAFEFLGRNSMYVLCVHVLDENYSFLWAVTQNEFINCALRTTIDVFFVFWIVALRERVFNKWRIESTII